MSESFEVVEMLEGQWAVRSSKWGIVAWAGTKQEAQSRQICHRIRASTFDLNPDARRTAVNVRADHFKTCAYCQGGMR